MKKLPLVLVILSVVFFVSPAMADETLGRYSYIQIESVLIDVVDLDQAVFDIKYHVDDNVDFLVLLLGKNDLKEKLCDIFDLEDCSIESVGSNHARFVSDIHSYNNGDGTYWFPEISFKIEVPNVTVRAQENYRRFDSIQEFPGIGYYYMDE